MKKGKKFDPRIGCDGECGNCNLGCENKDDNISIAESKRAETAAEEGAAV